jgi:hypothetical protein
MKHEYETQQVKEDARGRWERVLLDSGATAESRAGTARQACALSGSWRSGWLSHFPGCRGYGRRHLQYLRQFCQRVCAADVDQWLGVWPCDPRSGRTGRQPGPVAVAKHVEDQAGKSDDEIRREQLNRTWRESLSLVPPECRTGTFVSGSTRLVVKVPDTLRFHPSLGYYADNRLVADYPTLIAQVTGQGGEAVTIHRTYLTPDGQGAGRRPQEADAPSFGPSDDRGCYSTGAGGTPTGRYRGIETALAVIEATGISGVGDG